MTNARRTGKGSRTKPIVLEEPELIHDLSKEERAAAVSALADILADWWARQHRERTQIADTLTGRPVGVSRIVADPDKERKS